jgi:hypothetical protein
MARAACKVRLKRVEYNLLRAMEQADRRGYTGMIRSKGSLFDDPRVKSLMKKRDMLLRKC